MHKANAADELAEVRAAIARLRLREARICATILAAPEEAADGIQFRAEVAERRFRLFDPALLPGSVLSDPRYWRESVSREVRCLPAADAPPMIAAPPRCPLH